MPLPVPPMMPSVSPFLTEKETSSSTGAPPYEKLTFSKRMNASSSSASQGTGSRSAGRSSTSSMRAALAVPLVSITKMRLTAMTALRMMLK